MGDRHTITHANDMYHGNVFYGAYSPDGRRGVKLSHLVYVSLGAPITSDTDGLLDGATVATDSVWTYTASDLITSVLDVPRNLIIDSTDATASDAVVTITGADVYGATMVEQLTMAGTTAANGKKAFKTLTSVSVGLSTYAATIDIGWGNVFGLPFRIDSKRYVRDTRQDNTAEVWTVVVADTDQDATAGDNRGTIVPTATPNAVLEFSCLVVMPNLHDKAEAFGADQYAG